MPQGVISDAWRRQRRQRLTAASVFGAIAVVMMLFLAAGGDRGRGPGSSTPGHPGGAVPALAGSTNARLLLADQRIGYALWLDGRRHLSCLTIVPTKNSPDPAGGGSLCNAPTQFERRGEQGAMLAAGRTRRVDFGFVPGDPQSMTVSTPPGAPRPVLNADHGAYLITAAQPGDMLDIHMANGSTRTRALGN